MKSQGMPLRGVGGTALWTLYCRASFPQLLVDPVATRIRDQLDLPFRQVFGRPDPAFAHRAAVFDHHVRTFLEDHPGASVVSLGEGLETQRFRIHGYHRWTSVDLPETMELRERFIQSDLRHRHLPGSALDRGWMDQLGPGPGCVVAQGLMMYLPLSEVQALLQTWATQAQGGFIFDVVPPWVSRLTRMKVPMTSAYRLPVMPWGMSPGSLQRQLKQWLGPRGTVELTSIPLPAGPLPFRFRSVVACLRLRPATVPVGAARPPASLPVREPLVLN